MAMKPKKNPAAGKGSVLGNDNSGMGQWNWSFLDAGFAALVVNAKAGNCFWI
jgi:hypothetical protein